MTRPPRCRTVCAVYRLLATDIDDTLTDHDGTIHPDSRAALIRLHDEGIEVVLSSGRATASMKRVATSLFGEIAPRYLIAFNGAHLFDAVEDRLLFSQDLSPAAVRAVVDYAHETQLYIQGFDDTYFIVESESEFSHRYGRGTAMPHRVVDDLATDRAAGSPKLLLIGDHEELLVHHDILAERAQNRWRVTFSKPHLLEVMAPEVSKGAALAFLAGELGIPLAQVVAAGDGLNDSEMIETAGMGVAVGNAHPRLKAAADWVCTRSAGEGAVAAIVDRFFPINARSQE